MKSSILLAILSVVATTHTTSAQAPLLLWRYNYNFGAAGGYGSSPAIGHDGTIYVGPANMTAVNPNGTLKWRFNTAGSGGALAVGVDETIYFTCSATNLYAVSPDGTLKWQFSATDINNSSPAIAQDGTIYFGSQDGRLYAVYPDGTKRWEYWHGNPFNYGSPVVAQDGTVFIGSVSQLLAITTAGSRKWYVNGLYDIYCSPATDTNGIVYLTAHNAPSGNSLYAFYPNGSQKWVYTMDSSADAMPEFSSPAIDTAGNVYACGEAGLYCIRPDGALNWLAPLDVAGSSPAIRDDGSIIVAGRSYVACVTSAGSLDWQFPVTNAVYSAVTIGSQGTIYFTAGSFLYALAGGHPPAPSAWPMYKKDPAHTGRFTPQSEGPPVLGLQPVSQTAILNSSIYFRVFAGGTPPLHFQWYKDTLPISGATNSVLGITSVQLADSGTYTVTVTNQIDSTTSDQAILTVMPGLDLALYAGITIHGQAGALCQIQYSYDLSNTNNWTPLTNFALPTATYLWIDPTPAATPRRYYRAILSP